jgi:hypothetical protein
MAREAETSPRIIPEARNAARIIISVFSGSDQLNPPPESGQKRHVGVSALCQSRLNACSKSVPVFAGYFAC